MFPATEQWSWNLNPGLRDAKGPLNGFLSNTTVLIFKNHLRIFPATDCASDKGGGESSCKVGPSVNMFIGCQL